MRRQKITLPVFTILLVIAFVLAALSVKPPETHAAGSADAPKIYMRPAPNFDLNVSRRLKNARKATPGQLQSLEAFKGSTGASNLTVR